MIYIGYFSFDELGPENEEKYKTSKPFIKF